MFFVNQLAPVNANAGVTNIQNVTQPFSSTYTNNVTTAAQQAQQTAVAQASQSAGFLGLDPMTWLTIISLILYVGFTLEDK